MCEGLDDFSEFNGVPSWQLRCFDIEGAGRLLHGLPKQVGVRGRVRVKQKCYTPDFWRDMLQSLKPLAAHRELEIGEPGEVPPRARQVGYKAVPNGVHHLNKDDR